MPGIALYDASIGNLINGTVALRDILKKASESSDASSFPQARIHADMQPLTFQVKIAALMAQKTINELTGGDVELTQGKDTMDEMIALCEKNIELLRKVDAKSLEGKETETLSVKLGAQPNPVELTGQQFVLGYVLPNLFFHVTTAYDILRMKGVPLGKKNYLDPFMSAVKK